jgi:hypothetical protein
VAHAAVTATALCAVVVSFTACHDTTVGAGQAAAVSLDTIPYPSIVAGDSLRDSLGVARPFKGTAYGDNGAAIPGFIVKYRALDSGIVLDSLTGYAVGDTARSTPIRILADAGGLQTTPVQIFIVPRPDTVFADSATDTLRYSIFDTSAVVSSGLSVTVGHKVTPTVAAPATYIPVQAYLVSYQMVYPTDTTWARIVDGVGHSSNVDTTGGDGKAHPNIRVRPLTLQNSTDSVVILATVRSRGDSIPPSPIRLVVQVRPNQ